MKLQDEGRAYDVAIAFQKIMLDGKVKHLSGIGVSQKFGKPAHTAVKLGTGEELLLDTKKGEAGDRSVLCTVTFIDADRHSTQSEFTLLAHE